jgi:bifunctional UDP-N-acetylglucosamine pyrophosphorylase / glucosamine-1-phosphate N-acetyltransferase
VPGTDYRRTVAAGAWHPLPWGFGSHRVSDIHVVVLAAGKGTRMKSQLPKVLHRIGGLTIIERVVRTASALQPASINLVVGHGADEVKRSLVKRQSLQFVTQEQQLGTGHALLQTRPNLEGKKGTVVLLSGDAPLLTANSLHSLLDAHRAAAAAATVITAIFPRPFGYGRVVRNKGNISKIVEERDATSAQKAITEINSGIYAFDLAPLFAALDTIGTANKQGEYYLPDLIAIYRKQKKAVATWTVERGDEIRGINSRNELAEVTSMVRQQKNEELMAAGVTLIDPATTYVDADVIVGPDTVIHPCVFLEGSTKIGSACEIQSGARIVNSTIGDRVCVRNHTVVTDSTVEAGAFLGPFAHIRPGSKVGEDAHIGNFVELKKTDMGKGAKANHLAYLGDSTIGEKTNVGAGTITCNYDGEKKHRTVIGAGVFVGSNSTLVAPVTLADGSYIAAGSAVTTDVPAGALAIGRARQENKEGWVAQKKAGSRKPKAES